MESIRQDRSLVEFLLYRHFRRYSGLVLPTPSGLKIDW
jgi:hypothetical protein